VARQDASPLDGFATSDVRVLDVQGGELDAGQWTSVLQQGAAMGLKVSTKVEAVAWEGETVRAVARWSLHRGMRQGASIAMARQEVVAHDVWVRIGAEWRLRRSAAVRSKIWVNGELFDDAKATTPLEPAQRDAIAGEVRARAIPFDTVMAGSGFDDLSALSEMIGDARIVALGEATHGTAEFFRMKHRLFEYLVEKKGFTVFAFEANWPLVEIADRYIKTGEGSAAAALREIGFWIWATDGRGARPARMDACLQCRSGPHQASVVHGFRHAASGGGRQVCHRGVQTARHTEIEAIKAYYDGAADMYKRIAPLEGDKDMSEAEKAKLRANVAAGLKLVEQHREVFLRRFTPAEYARVSWPRLMLRTSGS
jgi:hypothetical protein